MKKALKSEAIEHKNNSICTVTEFPSLDHMIDFAIAKVSGRYPEQGYAMNNKCKEIVYIQEGTGRIIVNCEEHPLSAGDLVLIEPTEHYCWDGNMTLSISCRPAWTPDQHQIVND